MNPSSLSRIVILGGAGFVGSNLAAHLVKHAVSRSVVALDNLSRRGAELNARRLQELGVEFVHADVRSASDLESVGDCEVIIDCAANPSVSAGYNASPRGVLETNLLGTINALEHARKVGARLLFLSTSRVYPIGAVNEFPFLESESRFYWDQECLPSGISASGITEDYWADGSRSFYGSSKLSSEHIIKEYTASYGVPSLINRCGLLSGPWQFAKADQGVVALWVACHHYRKGLKYIGFGGLGKQVRDVLHIVDLAELVTKQLCAAPDLWDGTSYNVGGGRSRSTSLLELTQLCQNVLRAEIDISSNPQTSTLDVRILMMDSKRVGETFDWSPQRSVEDVVVDLSQWISEHESILKPILCG